MSKITGLLSKYIDKVPNWVWYILGGIVAVLVLGYAGLLVYRWYSREQEEDLEEQIEILKGELESRYSSSKYAKQVIELELAAFTKVAELKAAHKYVVELGDPERIRLIEEQLHQIENLKQDLGQVVIHHEQAEARLRGLVTSVKPPLGKNALKATTGQIVLVRHMGKYAAILPIDQASEERGSFIRYFWWYQPDGTGILTNSNALTGFGETGEGKGNQITAGPLKLGWSKSKDGLGWIYFGPTVVPSPDYELAYTSQSDVSKIDAATYVYLKPDLDDDEEDSDEDDE